MAIIKNKLSLPILYSYASAAWGMQIQEWEKSALRTPLEVRVWYLRLCDEIVTRDALNGRDDVDVVRVELGIGFLHIGSGAFRGFTALREIVLPQVSRILNITRFSGALVLH